jgi:hypothetical protein
MKKHIKHRTQFKSLDETTFYSGPEAASRFERVMKGLLSVSKEELDTLRKEHKKRRSAASR